jgi:hypothetical protein
MEGLSSQQQQKRQMMRLPRNAAEEFDLNSIDWDVPLFDRTPLDLLEDGFSVRCYLVEPSANVRKMPNTQLAR